MSRSRHGTPHEPHLPLWWHGVMAIYQILLPLVLLLALPGWIVKMLRRGGMGTGLHERLGLYAPDDGFEPCGAIHLHAISVGETMLALRLVRAWRGRNPAARFVIASGTATGHAVASSAALPGVRVTYAPLDVKTMVDAYLRRFEPARIILVEGEVWPNLIAACEWRGIPVSLVNARMSPRSERRYRALCHGLRPMFSRLSLVALQEAAHREIWELLGVDPARIHHVGSLKFDPGSNQRPSRRPSFQTLLDAMGDGPVILAASTHPGEEAFLASMMRKACPKARLLIAPRHAERAGDAARALAEAGFPVQRRSKQNTDWNSPASPPVLLIDTTGELRDWTAHADIVLIGKSFLSRGGQNPVEAIVADAPVIFGPHMQNFEPLASQLVATGGAIRAQDESEITTAIRTLLDPETRHRQTQSAHQCLSPHEGAIERVVRMLGADSDGEAITADRPANPPRGR